MTSVSLFSSPEPLEFNEIPYFGQPKSEHLTPNEPAWLHGSIGIVEGDVTQGAASIADILAQEIHAGLLDVGGMLQIGRAHV